jgi:hypothetical protein
MQNQPGADDTDDTSIFCYVIPCLLQYGFANLKHVLEEDLKMGLA